MPHDGTGHGTCCAGLVAAEANNNLGVAGVAWDCQIMPIRMIDGMKIRSELNLVAALDWARLHGARVASMSWRWLGPRSFFDAAITAAHTAGMVLVAAAGNGSVRMIDYPASHPLVMAVGATDMQDQRKTTSSPDREQWGSQYGSGLSVMAPGVACWTTDLTGTAGFNKNNGGTVTFGGVTHDHSGSPDGKYFAWMNGTSAAAPQLAGLAGLLMSERPSLSPEEVRRGIESTCGKVGGYPYAVVPGNPNGTWHEEMGYGRIDILSCMQIHAPRAASPASAFIA
jgi:subtilisin family serine protease